MRINYTGTMGPKLLTLFYMAVILVLANCYEKVSDDNQRARLPEFLTELDLASLEASEEDIESLKKVVKRLAPAKNGEYLMYQGVMGQPGVDFPVLTTIPATKFSCRKLKGGYYADLETNCQVFHICDNGRKISFLCPNGTIFQQSQLICDWWFKVDCGKSAELYEQSAEQLAEEERKRAETKKMNSEFHRSTNNRNNLQINHQTQNQNVDYDGRQNGRTNPFGQNNNEKQDPNSQEIERDNTLAAINSQQNGRNGNQFGQGQVVNSQQPITRGNQYNQNFNHNQQSEGQNLNDQQSTRQSFNNYNSRNAQTKSAQNSQDFFGSLSNSNSPRDEKSGHRSPKAFTESRNNYNEITSTANPFKEYQQPAESAAFATSRNNRYNKPFQYNQFGNYYSPNQLSSTEKYQNDVQGSFGSGNHGIRQNQGNKKDSNVPLQTFSPIYKPPRTTSTTPSPYLGITTQKSYVNTDIYRHNTATQTPYVNSESVSSIPYQTSVKSYEDTSAANYQQKHETSSGNIQAGSYFEDTRNPSTQKPYVNTDTYRQSGFTTVTDAPTTWNSYDQTATTLAPRGTESFAGEATLTTERYNDNYGGNTFTGSKWNTVTEVTPGAFDTQNFNSGEKIVVNNQNVRGSIQKPNANGYQENVVTSRSLSPYDTSFTYKQGKISSTLGPYVPFTKNYAYSTTTTTTTNKPPVYTATVPTIPDHRKPGGSIPTAETPAYYQAGTTSVKGILQPEREHVIGMLHSLQELEATAPTSELKNGSRIGLNIPPSSGPSTLHTLALYFATASDNFDSNETVTDTAVRLGNAGDEEADVTTENSASAELPTSLLTQHTINSYADLFNINSALETVDNVTTNTRVAQDIEDYSSKDEVENDLDIQQSQGPVTGDNQRNNPKLRELAQVFTHALSAYLQDPDTFRKVLTEIRPTEPSVTNSGTESTESTTFYPTTQEDYPSATKEKDEVLDFSDVTKTSRRKKLTTPYPTTSQTFTAPPETTYQTYYTTPTPSFVDESLNEAQSSDFRSSDDVKRNNFAQEVNHAFRNSNSNELRNFNIDVTGPTGPSGPSASQNQYDSYVPIGLNFSDNRFGGFQNNSAPYGQGVRPADAAPIGNNYVPDSTPVSYSQTDGDVQDARDVGITTNGDPTREYGENRNANDFVTTRASQDSDFRTLNSESSMTATTSSYQENEVISTTREPFRINYYESSTLEPRNNEESLVTAGTVYSTYRNTYNDLWVNDKTTRPSSEGEKTTEFPSTITASTENAGNNFGRNNQQTSATHWTASPTVTRLWETTVFLDPKHINQGLTGSGVETLSTGGGESFTGTTPVSRQEILVTDASGIGKTTQYAGNANTPAWNWSANDNDSSTAFTLLPNVYSTENTATPSPTYTTHSSIITTITSSVSSSPAKSTRREKSYNPLRINVSAFNVTENEIVRAQEMFGNLNATSSNTLMKVMKQADNNSTVRQLVLLLISHCKGPMNKTMEEEKEQLLNALLKMPVNEFSSDESRDIIDGINNLQLPIGRSLGEAVSSTSPPTTVSVTTFHSRRGRKYRPSSTKGSTLTSSSSSSARSGDGNTAETANSLSIEAGSPSDNRALELLRSLYTIAAKWG